MACVPQFMRRSYPKQERFPLEELRDVIKSHGYYALVPHHIPDGIKLSAIYYKFCPLVVLIACGDNDVKRL